MKLQFDANQSFQLDAINAVADLIEGQPQGAPEFSVVQTGAWEGLFAGQARSELGAANQLLLPDSKLRSNAREIQLRNDIEISEPNAALLSWKLATKTASWCMARWWPSTSRSASAFSTLWSEGRAIPGACRPRFRRRTSSEVRLFFDDHPKLPALIRQFGVF